MKYSTSANSSLNESLAYLDLIESSLSSVRSALTKSVPEEIIPSYAVASLHSLSSDVAKIRSLISSLDFSLSSLVTLCSSDWLPPDQSSPNRSEIPSNFTFCDRSR